MAPPGVRRPERRGSQTWHLDIGGGGNFGYRGVFRNQEAVHVVFVGATIPVQLNHGSHVAPLRIGWGLKYAVILHLETAYVNKLDML